MSKHSGSLVPTPANATAQAALILATIFVAPHASAQTNPAAESPPTFGEISNQPPATAPQSPVPPTTPAPGATVPPATSTAQAAPVPGAVAPPAGPAAPAAAPPQAAATPEPKKEWVRDGFYLRLISGMGFMTLRGDGEKGKASVSGMSSNSIIAIGGSVAPGLVLAGTLQSTQVSSDFKGGPLEEATLTTTTEGAKPIPATKKATAAIAQFGAMLDWYPGASGAHVGLGAGLGMTSLVNQVDESSYYGTGFAGTVLVGYDWSIAPTWALGLALVATGATQATLKHAKTGNESPYRMMPFSVGITTSVLYF